MKTEELKNRLEAMKNRHFFLGENKVKILSFKIDTALQEFTLVTDSQWHTRHVSEANIFLMKFMLDRDSEVSNEVAKQAQESGNKLEEINNILMDNIKKVQADKTYVAQAQTICNHVNTLVNITKLQLAVAKQKA